MGSAMINKLKPLLLQYSKPMQLFLSGNYKKICTYLYLEKTNNLTINAHTLVTLINIISIKSVWMVLHWFGMM